MNYKEDQIYKLALSSGLYKNPSISYLAEGYGNINYLVSEEEKKCVLRIKKSTEKQFRDSLEKEFIFLSFFWKKGITCIPQPIYFSFENNFLIESYIEGEKINIKDFNDEQLRKISQHMIDLFNLDIDEFYDFCEKNNFKKIEPYSEKISVEKYGFQRFDQFKDSKKIPESIKTWIEDSLNKNLEYLDLMENNIEKGFNQGDLNSNVIISKGELYFYDFEHAAIYSGRGLSYLKIHAKIPQDKFDKLLNYYSEYSGISIIKLIQEINIEERLIGVNDVVWAAMKWAESETKKDKKYFEELTYKRKNLVENLEN